MTAQARHPTKATFMPFLCYWATLIKIFKNTYLLTGTRNATSTSKTVQEEVIRITGEYIRAKVTQPIQKEDAFFSIISDEVTDKYANQEMLSVCLRFLDLNNDVSPKIKELFFLFCQP